MNSAPTVSTLSQTIAGTALPLVPRLGEICASLAERGAAVLRADPGSGKSTLVPLALLDDAAGKSGGIVMLEPRRAAVLGIASRLAELLGEEPGGRAGYAVRLERRVSAKTNIEVVTEGILTRRMRENPSLFDRGVSTIIFDEFHERSIHADTAFAFALDLRRMGAQFRLLVMSATMDAGRVAACIDAAEGRPAGSTPVIECPGRGFPVETLYRPLPRTAPPDREIAAAVCDIAREEAAGGTGDILVFLPGRREIAACAERLAERGLDRDFDILPLHGSLPLDRQRKAIVAGEGRRRLILSTNVAETGLTIPGITLVIDSGLARIQRFHIPSGMNRLCLESVSRNSADQRAGRAGRLGPGRCIRLWPQGEERPRETPPEIARIDLSAAALDCLLWGVKRAEDLPWLDPPPAAAWNRALETLRGMGAADADNRPAALGRELARLGLEPRLARLCAAGRDAGAAPLACAAAAILAERDDSGIAGDDPDFGRRLSAARNNAGGPWARRVRQTAADLLKRLGLSVPLAWTATDEAGVGELLAAAFPDRVAKRRDIGAQAAAGVSPNVAARGGEGVFRFASGREGRVQAPFAAVPWLCALEVDAGERMGYIRLAVAVSETAALAALAQQTPVTIEKTVEWKGLVPRLIETSAAGRLTLGVVSRPCVRGELLGALSPLLRERGLAALPWDGDRGAPRRLLERIRFYAAHANSGGAWDDAALVEDAADWLGPFVWNGDASGKGAIIDEAGLCHALGNRLGWEARREMDQLVPDQFTLPSGRKRAIDYGSGEPVLSLRLQDAFGITGGREVLSVPVVFHLLSPAGRPVQITRDLDGFWSGSYAEVRKEMRGRYPRHHWPENPAAGAGV